MSAGPPRDLRELIQSVMDGTGDDSDLHALESSLRHDPAARREYLRYMNMHYELQATFRPPFDQLTANHARHGCTLPWLALAACATVPVVVLSISVYYFSDYTSNLDTWANSVSSVLHGTAGILISLLATGSVVGRVSGLSRIPGAWAIVASASLILGVVGWEVCLARYTTSELIRRELLIQDHNWVSYDSAFYWPKEQIGKPHDREPTDEQVRLELRTLRGVGFTGLYLHECRHGQVRVPAIARELGFSAIVQAIRVSDSRHLEGAATQDQIRNAVSIRNLVDAYVLGEMNAREVDLVALKRELANLRRKTGKPVTASFLQDDYVGLRGASLRELSDFSVRGLERPWAVESEADPHEAARHVARALRDLRDDSKPSLLTFVYFPSAGGAAFSEQRQAQFFEDVAKVRLPRGVNIVYFNSFDRPWAIERSRIQKDTPLFEGHTGLFKTEMLADNGHVRFTDKIAVASIRAHFKPN